MKRFLGCLPRAVSRVRRAALEGGSPTSNGARGTASSALVIEELEPRLTPDYWGVSGSGGSGDSSSGGSGTPPPGRTVGWGC
jgi:hypothetical protein